MSWDKHFTGREEKRLPVMIEVKLAPAENASTERREQARVENISGRGARLHASGPWQLGERVEITPIQGEGPLQGEVIYCQKLKDNRFVVGVKFRRNPSLSSMVQELKGKVR